MKATKQDLSIFIMMLAIIAALSMTSCVTQKQVDKICSSGACPKTIEVRHDTIVKEKIEYIKADPLLDSLLFVSAWNPEKETDTVFIKDAHWEGLFYISTGKLNAKIKYLSDSLETIKTTLSTNVTNDEVKTVEVIKTVEKPIRDKWYFRFMFGFFGTWLFILVGLIAWVWWQCQKGKIKWLAFLNR